MPDYFSAAATAAAVHATLDEAMATIPPGKRGALLVRVDETTDGPQAAVTVAGHIGGNWEVAGGGSWSRQTGPTATFGVMGSW